MRNSRFGKSSLDCSFTSGAYFDYILLLLLNVVVLSQSNTVPFILCYPLFFQLHSTLQWSKRIDWPSLGQSIMNSSTQERISTKSVEQFLAVVLFCDFDLFTVNRSLRGTYTGEFRNTFNTINTLCNICYDPVLIKEISRTLLVDCPNKSNTTSSHDDVLKFFRYSDHTFIKRNLPKVFKNLDKENKKQYMLPISDWLARFVKNFHLNLQDILFKPRKNNQLI